MLRYLESGAVKKHVMLQCASCVLLQVWKVMCQGKEQGSDELLEKGSNKRGAPEERTHMANRSQIKLYRRLTGAMLMVDRVRMPMGAVAPCVPPAPFFAKEFAI